MPAFWKLPLLAAVAVTAVAQTTIVDFLIIGADYFDAVGSVVKIESSITTVHIGCDPHSPTSTCPLATGSATILQGPSTWSFLQEGSYTRDCKLSLPDFGYSCVATAGTGKSATTSTVVDEPYTGFLYAVAVTAGAEKLPTGLTRRVSDDIGPGETTPGRPTVTSGVTSAAVTTATTATTAPSASTTRAASTTSNAAARPAATQKAALAGVGLAALAMAL